MGYEKRSIAEYIAILSREHIGAVVDVRDVAWSHKPGFAKSALQKHLTAAGVEYVHAQFAGNPKRLRAEGGTDEQLVARYARHLDENPAVVEQFDRVIADLRARGIAVALLCFERDAARCHRSVLAGRWQTFGPRSVRHLVD